MAKATVKDIAQDNGQDAKATRDFVRAEAGRHSEVVNQTVGFAIIALFAPFVALVSQLRERFGKSSTYSIADVAAREFNSLNRYSSSLMRAITALYKGGYTQQGSLEPLGEFDVSDIARAAEQLEPARQLVGTMKQRGLIDGETLRGLFALIREQFIKADGSVNLHLTANGVKAEVIRKVALANGYAVSFVGTPVITRITDMVMQRDSDDRQAWAFPNVGLGDLLDAIPSKTEVDAVGIAAVAE